MAKKSRRSRVQSKAPVRKQPVSQPEPVKTEDRTPSIRHTTAPAPTAAAAPASLQMQRKYVMTELRRIGIIAGSLIVILIILSFIL